MLVNIQNTLKILLVPGRKQNKIFKATITLVCPGIPNNQAECLSATERDWLQYAQCGETSSQKRIVSIIISWMNYASNIVVISMNTITYRVKKEDSKFRKTNAPTLLFIIHHTTVLTTRYPIFQQE